MPIQQMLIGISKGEQFAEATGGTVTEVGDYKVHAFTSSGTFTVTQLADTNEFETLIVAGGAGPGTNFSSGGGGGGGIINHQTGQALTAAAYTITVGAGGSGATGNTGSHPNTPTGNEGSDSSIKLASNSSIILEADISDIAPNSGRSDPTPQANNQATWSVYAHFVGGNSAKVVNGTLTQYTGGGGYHSVAYAGGGAGSGDNGTGAHSTTDNTQSYTPSWATGGSYSAGGGGGDGYSTNMVSGSTAYYGGGGGAGTAANGASNMTTYRAPGGQGGGGLGANRHYSSTPATNGAVNTGGGGGGGHSNTFGGNIHNAGNGGSGIVYIKYKFR